VRRFSMNLGEAAGEDKGWRPRVDLAALGGDKSA
jgi:hypothetical protein